MSDFEGMQVSVAEGFCSGGLGMTLNWRGAEQGYPQKWVFNSEEEMTDALAAVIRGDVDLEAESAVGRDLMRSLYSIDQVWSKIEELVKAVRA